MGTLNKIIGASCLFLLVSFSPIQIGFDRCLNHYQWCSGLADMQLQQLVYESFDGESFDLTMLNAARKAYVNAINACIDELDDCVNQ